MQFVDQGRSGGEANGETLLAGGQPEPQRDVGLAGAAVAERDDVLAAGYILRAGQFQHQGLVERWDGGEVEAVETLHCWEPGLLDPALDGPPFPVDHLKLGQAQQVARVIDTFGGALARQLVVLTQEGWEPKRLEVMGEQNLRCIAHDAAPPASRLR